MKTTVLLMLAAATTLAQDVKPAPPDPARLVGRWSGNGSFYEADLQTKVDSLPFILEFAADGSAAGRLGRVKLTNVRVKHRRDLIELTARLTGPVSPDPAFAKNRIVVLITALGDTTMKTEFHLKSNSVFDPRMREGHSTLRRVR